MLNKRYNIVLPFRFSAQLSFIWLPGEKWVAL